MGNIDIDPVDVRLAVPDDRNPILALTSLLHGENGLFSVDPNKVDLMLDRYFNRQGAVIGVIGPAGAPIAAIYLGVDQLSYTNDWALIEQFNFVHKDHRNSNYAKQLICYAKRVSDQMQVPLMTGILSNKRTAAKERFYEQLMDRAGAYYLYNLQYASGPGWGK